MKTNMTIPKLIIHLSMLWKLSNRTRYLLLKLLNLKFLLILYFNFLLLEEFRASFMNSCNQLKTDCANLQAPDVYLRLESYPASQSHLNDLRPSIYGWKLTLSCILSLFSHHNQKKIASLLQVTSPSPCRILFSWILEIVSPFTWLPINWMRSPFIWASFWVLFTVSLRVPIYVKWLQLPVVLILD